MTTDVERYKKRLSMKELSVFAGIAYPGNAERHKQIRELQLKPDDVAVICFPKSGTHWLYGIVSYINSTGDLEKVTHYPFLPMEVSPPFAAKPALELIEECPSPRIITSHLPFELCPRDLQEGKCKVILVVRNPKDVAVSLFHFHNFFKELGDFDGLTWNEYFEAFMGSATPYGSWFGNIKSWLNHRDDPNVLLVRYEDLKKDLVNGVSKVAEFMGRPLSGDRAAKIAELCDFGNVQKKGDKTTGRVLRKGIVGGWKSYFTVAQNERFDEIYRREMGQCDLEMNFEN